MKTNVNTSMNPRWRGWGLGLALVASVMLAAGCASQKEPANKAVADIEASLSSVQADAAEYASAELQSVQDGLASLKASLANNDYKAVLAAAPAVSSQVAALQDTVAQKKQDAQAALAAATEQWKSLSADVPNMLSAIQSRVDMLRVQEAAQERQCRGLPVGQGRSGGAEERLGRSLG